MTTILDQIAKDVVIKHRCHCKTADEQPADGEPDEHVFTVDGEEFPWFISERGQIVKRLADDLYSIDVEIVGISKDTVLDGERPYHRFLEFTYNTYGGHIAYIPTIDGKEFPWLLTEAGCQINFGHKILPRLQLAFLAHNVTGNVPVDDQRVPGQNIYVNGGGFIPAGMKYE